MATPIFNGQEFKQRIVCFLDILGFSSEIQEIANDSDTVKTIGTLLYELKYHENIQQIVKEFQIDILSVSDCVIISCPIKDQAHKSMFQVFTVAQMYQQILLFNGFRLSSGYITEGVCYHKDDIIFGSAYNEAYERHATHAEPIVVVKKEVAEKYCSSFANQNPHTENKKDILRRVEDGPYFINFLWKVEALCQKNRIDPRDCIQTLISESEKKNYEHMENKRVQEKYIWINRFLMCRQNRV